MPAALIEVHRQYSAGGHAASDIDLGFTVDV